MNQNRKPDLTPSQAIPLVVVGCDFRIASSGLRELLVTTEQARSDLFKAIQQIDPNAGFMALETCNRIEWILSTVVPEWIGEILAARMVSHWQTDNEEITQLANPYSYYHDDAARHVLRVVVGMESLATGEAQIAGQFQRAVRRAQREGTSSCTLNSLAAIAGRLAKLAYKIGFRAHHSHGIHGLTASFILDRVKPKSTDLLVLVVGMGEIGKRTADVLHELIGCRVLRFNRTVAQRHSSVWLPLPSLPNYTQEADALIIATSARTPIIDASLIDQTGRTQPLLLMDLGIPRQVEEKLRTTRGIDYRTLDDLLEERGAEPEQQLRDQMEQKITRALNRFRRSCRERNMVKLLDTLAQQRQVFLQQFVPQFVREQVNDMAEPLRKRIEEAMKQLLRAYSNEVFKVIHLTVESEGYCE